MTIKSFRHWKLSNKLWIPFLGLILVLSLAILLLTHLSLDRLANEHRPERSALIELGNRAFSLLSEIREYNYHPNEDTLAEIVKIKEELQEIIETLKALPGTSEEGYRKVRLASTKLIVASSECVEASQRLETEMQAFRDELIRMDATSLAVAEIAFTVTEQQLRLRIDPEETWRAFLRFTEETEIQETARPLVDLQRRIINEQLELDEKLESLEEAEQAVRVELSHVEQQLLQQLDRIPRLALGIIATVCALMILLGSWMALALAARITRPLKTLQTATDQFAEGQLQVRAEVAAKDEIGQLAQSFNHQAENISQLVQDLQVAREFSEQLLFTVPAGLVAVDQEGLVININPIAETMLREDFAIRPDNRTLGASLGSVELERAIQKVIVEGGEVRDLELSSGSPSQEKIWNATVVAITARDSSGAIWPERGSNSQSPQPTPRALVVFQDVTERQQLMQHLKSNLVELRTAQEQLVQSGKMVAIGELASGIAHELNNPLTAVITYSVLLNEKLEQLPDEVVAQLPKFGQRLSLIQSAADQCHVIVKDLLAFARQDNSQRVPTHLNDVIRRAIDLSASQLRKHRIEYKIELAAEDLMVFGNTNQLQQVIINLVLNGAQAMDPGGLLTISSSRLDGQKCEVRIEDTGSGIAEEDLPRIFEPFFTTKPSGKGTGLGLSIVYGIVNHHEGVINVDSTVGKGTVFQIVLPALRGSEVRE